MAVPVPPSSPRGWVCSPQLWSCSGPSLCPPVVTSGLSVLPKTMVMLMAIPVSPIVTSGLGVLMAIPVPPSSPRGWVCSPKPWWYSWLSLCPPIITLGLGVLPKTIVELMAVPVSPHHHLGSGCAPQSHGHAPGHPCVPPIVTSGLGVLPKAMVMLMAVPVPPCHHLGAGRAPHSWGWWAAAPWGGDAQCHPCPQTSVALGDSSSLPAGS